MEDRIPRYPGRVKITHADGTVEQATIERDDDPQQEGTLLNKATLLTDGTAKKYGFDSYATPDDVFSAIPKKFAKPSAFQKLITGRVI